VILLYKGIGPFSRAIRFRTRVLSWLPPEMDYSHVAWGTDRDTVIEAWPPEVREVGFHDGHRPGTMVHQFSVALSPDQEQRLELCLRSQIGKDYDWLGILGFLTRDDLAQRNGKWFCSELIAYAFEAAGKPLLARIRPHRMLPGMIALSPHLHYEGHRICGNKQAAESTPLASGAALCTM